MKAVVVFVLLFAAVYCHPVKRSASSSESFEVQPADTQVLKVTPVADVSSEEDDDDSDSDESDENGEATVQPVFVETTLIPVINGRGDSIGYQSDDKKPIYYADGNNIEKGPSSYKSYGSDKTKYNDVDLKVYKALQVQNVGLDQGMDASSGTDADDVNLQEQKSASSASDATPSEESDEDSQSSEENTTAANTTDSESSESDESDEISATEQPALIKSDNDEVVIA